MGGFFSISETNTVHLWQVDSTLLQPHTAKLIHSLNPEERERAARFLAPLHRDRFIIARSLLRQILCFYTQQPAETLILQKGPHEKPFLDPHSTKITFNLSHSDNQIIYAIGNTIDLGIDIEKMRDTIDFAIAKRFFAKEEYQKLDTLPLTEKMPAFYRFWTGKEAVIKMTGEGIFANLSEFFLDETKEKQTILLKKNRKCHLQFLTAPTAPYQAALATPEPVEITACWRLNEHVNPEKVQSLCFSPK